MGLSPWRSQRLFKARTKWPLNLIEVASGCTNRDRLCLKGKRASSSSGNVTTRMVTSAKLSSDKRKNSCAGKINTLMLKHLSIVCVASPRTQHHSMRTEQFYIVHVFQHGFSLYPDMDAYTHYRSAWSLSKQPESIEA